MSNGKKMRAKPRVWTFEERKFVAAHPENVGLLADTVEKSPKSCRRKVKANEGKKLALVERIRAEYMAGASVYRLNKTYGFRTDAICEGRSYKSPNYRPR